MTFSGPNILSVSVNQMTMSQSSVISNIKPSISHIEKWITWTMEEKDMYQGKNWAYEANPFAVLPYYCSYS